MWCHILLNDTIHFRTLSPFFHLRHERKFTVSLADRTVCLTFICVTNVIHSCRWPVEFVSTLHLCHWRKYRDRSVRPLFHLSHEHKFLWTIGQFFSVTNEMFAFLCTIGACAGFLFFETDRNFATLWPIETCVCFFISIRNGSFAFLRTIESFRPFICATDVRCTCCWPIEYQHFIGVTCGNFACFWQVGACVHTFA